MGLRFNRWTSLQSRYKQARFAKGWMQKWLHDHDMYDCLVQTVTTKNIENIAELQHI